MDPFSELKLAQGWALTQRYYAIHARRWTQHSFGLECLWDASVDALLEALANHRPEKGMAFDRFLWELTKTHWRTALRMLHRQKRDIRREGSGYPQAMRGKDSGQDIVDGRDLFRRAAEVLSRERFRALKKWSRNEIARRGGCVRRALSQLKEAV
jgi:hypothetical protein